MPTFSSAQVTDPFLSQNELLAPMLAHIQAQEKLGNLDIERQKFGLEKAKFDRGVTEGEGYIGGSLSGTAGGDGGGGGGGTYAPGTPFTPKMLPPGVSLDEDAMVRTIAGEAGGQPLQGQIAVAHVINTRAKGAGVSPRDVVFSPNQFEPWNGGAARARLEAMQPTDPAYQAILNTVVRPVMAGKAADPTGGATHFYAPVAQKSLGREPPSWGRGTPSAVIGGHNFYKLGYGPGRAQTASAPPASPEVATPAAPPPFNPNAGPRVGAVPPPPSIASTAPAIVPATAPGAKPPDTKVQIPPPMTTGQADDTADPNTAAVKQAATALLAMPEAEAAVAYGPTVRSLQAQGFAMQAPPTYPGHAALQALVGEGEQAAPAIEPSRQAMRLGGTDTADLSGATGAPAPARAPNVILDASGKPLLPPPPAPNQMMAGVGLPGVTIGLPTNGMAPPSATATPTAAPAAAPPGTATRPPLEAPPAAPSRTIQREPLLSNNLTASQQDAARRAIRSGTPLATVQAHVEQWKHDNIAERHQDAVDAAAQQQQNYERGEAYRKAQTEAEKTQYDRGRNAEADRIAREKAAAEAEQRKLPFQGNAENAQDRNILIKGDPKSPEYHSAYASFAEPKTQEGGLVIHPNMQPYRFPQDADGNPITTYGKPNISIGPGDLTKLRAFETGATTLKTALDDFAKTSRTASFGERTATMLGQPTDLSGAWTNAALMAKGTALYELGVLSGPDMTVLRSALADPSTFMGRVTSNETIDKQVNRIKALIDTRLDQARHSYGGGMSTGGAPSAPATPPPQAERPPLSSFAR